jgi:hypothetical protein
MLGLKIATAQERSRQLEAHVVRHDDGPHDRHCLLDDGGSNVWDEKACKGRVRESVTRFAAV